MQIRIEQPVYIIKKAIMIIFICLVLAGCGNKITNDIQTHVTGRTGEEQIENIQTSVKPESDAVDKSELSGIAYNGSNLYVAAGSKGKILTSTDGVKWIDRQSGTDKSLLSVIWGKKEFVTVGDEGTILISKDGINWKDVNSGTNSSFLKVEWDGRLYIAVSSGTVLTSVDGEVWAKKEVPVLKLNNDTDDKIPYYIADVLWDGKQYIAAGGGNFILTSEMFDNWVIRVPNSRGTGMFCDLTWNGKRYIAVGDHLAMTTSLDGYRWTNEGLRINKIESVDDSYTLCLKSVIWGQDKFIAVGHRGLILESKDGLEWSVLPTYTRARLSQVLWDGKQFIAVGDNETILTSTDGVKWIVNF